MKPKNPVMFEIEFAGYATPCWLWKRGKNQYGYGTKYVHPKKMLAHRWIYQMVNGPIPLDLDLDHLCRNPACVRPNHMEPVSHAVNIQRGANAKFTRADVEEIRACQLAGESRKSIARRLDVPSSTISRICSGKLWRAV